MNTIGPLFVFHGVSRTMLWVRKPTKSLPPMRHMREDTGQNAFRSPSHKSCYA